MGIEGRARLKNYYLAYSPQRVLGEARPRVRVVIDLERVGDAVTREAFVFFGGRAGAGRRVRLDKVQPRGFYD